MVHVTTSHKAKLITKQGGQKMRKPSVKRTINTLNVTVLGMDTVSCELITKTYPLYKSEVPSDEAKLFDYIRKMYEKDTFKISAITDKTQVAKTYTMPLSKFIEEAEVVGETQAKDETVTADTADTAQ